MTGKKDLNQKSQIREYPSNPCHPCSFLIDEYYFINQQIQLIQRSRFVGLYPNAGSQPRFSVIGGGHSAAVVQQLGMDSQLDYVSTSGGACIDFLAGEKLPGIEALKEAAAWDGVK